MSAFSVTEPFPSEKVSRQFGSVKGYYRLAKTKAVQIGLNNDWLKAQGLVSVKEQRVITLPKRLRYFLLRDNELTGRVLQISLRVIERTLRVHCPDAPLKAKYGGMTYIHRFGSMLNAHLHYHSYLIDGLFAQTENGLQFYKTVGLTQKVIQTAQETISKRVLRLFVRRDLLSSDESEQMQIWENGGGFSLHAQVTIAANDKKGLERLFRYCARPIYAGERLDRVLNISL